LACFRIGQSIDEPLILSAWSLVVGLASCPLFVWTIDQLSGLNGYTVVVGHVCGALVKSNSSDLSLHFLVAWGVHEMCLCLQAIL